MRAYDIALFLVLVQASIAFVDSSGMFTQHYYDVPKNNASYVLTDLESYQSGGINGTHDIQSFDAIDAITGGWNAIKIALNILLSVVFVLPALMDVFGIEPILALFIQVGVYIIYALAYAQIISNRGLKNYE